MYHLATLYQKENTISFSPYQILFSENIIFTKTMGVHIILSHIYIFI